MVSPKENAQQGLQVEGPLQSRQEKMPLEPGCQVKHQLASPQKQQTLPQCWMQQASSTRPELQATPTKKFHVHSQAVEKGARLAPPATPLLQP